MFFNWIIDNFLLLLNFLFYKKYWFKIYFKIKILKS